MVAGMCSRVCVEVFSVPVEERRYKEMTEQQFGDPGCEQAKICADIVAKTGQLLSAVISLYLLFVCL
jgi:hypothetical protein